MLHKTKHVVVKSVHTAHVHFPRTSIYRLLHFTS